jgi:hypothetical protein
MWTYFGSKSNVVDLYPKPTEDTIVEPFAGTARYSLKYFDREIILVEKYDVIVNIWKWLQKCSKKDIDSLPHHIKPGQKISEFKISHKPAEDLMGFIIGYGMERPRNTASVQRMIQRPNHVNYSLKKIAANLEKIRHWKILLDSYENTPNIKATWFIDPPYQYGGDSYVCSNRHINYEKLAKWSLERLGHVIVCENTKANWLPFKHLRHQKGSKGIKQEAIWSNIFTHSSTVQTLF